MSKARTQKTTTNNSSNPYEDRVGLPYLRVSSKRQEVEGTGLQSQEGRCIKELASLGVPHCKTFPDSYTGGGDFMKRPAMKAMIKFIDDNPHKKFVVIFDDLKRFARDVEFHIKLRAVFRSRDVVLRCLNYNFDESPEGRFAELIMAGHAELERHQNKRQVVQKQRARLEAGYWAFGSKKGYKMTPNPMHGMLSVPKKPEAQLLKTALEGFSTGVFIRPIDACKYLVEQGFWNRKPERYTEKFIAYTRDVFYAGYIEYTAWEVSRRIGRHEGIISLETFNLNQKRLNQKSTSKRIRIDVCDEFAFRGLIICDECGSHLTGTHGNGCKNTKKYAYYFCQNAKCSLFKKTIRKDDIEKRFKTLLEKQNLKPDVDILLRVVFDRVWSDEIKNFEQSRATEVRAKLELKEKIARLADMAGTTKSDTVRGAYEKQIEELAPQLDKLEQDQEQAIEMDIPYRTALEKASILLKSPYKYWESVDVLEKQRLFFFIFDEKLPYSKNIGYRTDKIPMSTRLFEEFAVTNPLDVEMEGSEPSCNK